MRLLVSVLASVALVGCSAATHNPAGVESSSVPPAPTTVVTSAPAPKQTRYIGRLNPAVTQKTLKQTVCKAGWTKSIRPSESYTNALKRKQLPKNAKLSAYEEDHLMPLELGGAPRDPANLAPIPIKQAKYIDVQWETPLHAELCAGKISLAVAQSTISSVKRQPLATPAPTPAKTSVKPTPRPRSTTPKPTPKPSPRPRTTAPASVYYANCDAVRAAGKAPLYAGQPGYRPGLDRDHDGVACES